MRRITKQDLDGLINRLNKLTKSPETSYTKIDGKYRANIGNYRLDGAYGGWKLMRICSEGGGVQDVLHMGYCSKPEAYRLIYAYINGIEAVSNEK